jgi:hypothetical protein
MRRSLGIISGAFALRNHAFERRNRVAALDSGSKMRIGLIRVPLPAFRFSDPGTKH